MMSYSICFIWGRIIWFWDYWTTLEPLEFERKSAEIRCSYNKIYVGSYENFYNPFRSKGFLWSGGIIKATYYWKYWIQCHIFASRPNSVIRNSSWTYTILSGISYCYYTICWLFIAYLKPWISQINSFNLIPIKSQLIIITSNLKKIRVDKIRQSAVRVP